MFCYCAKHKQCSTKCPWAHQTKGTQDSGTALSTLKEQALNVPFIKMIDSKEGTEGSIFLQMQNSEKVWIPSSTNRMDINIHVLPSKAITGESSRLSSEQDERMCALIKFFTWFTN